MQHAVTAGGSAASGEQDIRSRVPVHALPAGCGKMLNNCIHSANAIAKCNAALRAYKPVEGQPRRIDAGTAIALGIITERSTIVKSVLARSDASRKSSTACPPR